MWKGKGSNGELSEIIYWVGRSFNDHQVNGGTTVLNKFGRNTRTSICCNCTVRDYVTKPNRLNQIKLILIKLVFFGHIGIDVQKYVSHFPDFNLAATSVATFSHFQFDAGLEWVLDYIDRRVKNNLRVRQGNSPRHRAPNRNRTHWRKPNSVYLAEE